MVKNNKGHIVEIASMSSFVGVGIFSDYSACKTALISFTESEFHHEQALTPTCFVHADIQVSENSFEDGTKAPTFTLLSFTPSSSRPP
jgi:hypothetical protein